MIIYEKSIADFEKQCSTHRDELIAEIKCNLREKLGRGVSLSEERSWRQTLVQICKYFEKIREKNGQYILLEFVVPTTLKRIDIMLVGSNGEKTTLLIIEMKGWGTSYESDIGELLKIKTSYHYSEHPCYQVKNYKEVLTKHFSNIENEFDNIECISVLPNYVEKENDPIKGDKFNELLRQVPIFLNNDSEKLINYLDIRFKKTIEKKKVNFLNQLEYKPSIEFRNELKKSFNDIKLSESQGNAYSVIKNKLKILIENDKQKNQKSLIIISGTPGSGKTVIAFKVLAYIATKNISVKLQLPSPEFRESIKKNHGDNLYNNWIGGANSKGVQKTVIIDEAHKARANGNCKQFYDRLFSNSDHDLIIALIDNNQITNKRGITLEGISEIARKNYWSIEKFTLQEHFRNGADPLYIEWLRNWIFSNDEENLQEKYFPNRYIFEVLVDSDFHRKYNEYYDKYNVRMASFWTQPWNIGFDQDGEVLRKIQIGTEFYSWNPNEYWIKNYHKLFPNKKMTTEEKKLFKKIKNSNFNIDKINSKYIAYFNTIQGSEFEYIFVHIPKLFYLNEINDLDVDLSQLEMTDMKSQVWMKNKKLDPKRENDNKLYFKNRLLVNLTRGTKGTFIFCDDERLANWIKSKIIIKK